MSVKYDLPDLYLSEKLKYDSLANKINRTSTGNINFTSATSSITYTTNLGETDLLLQLQNALSNYLIMAKDLNDINTNLDSKVGSINDAINAVDNLYYSGSYDNTINYKMNNMVFYNNIVYINIVPCSGIYPTDGTKWLKLMDMVSFRGNFDNSAEYYPKNIVYYDVEKSLYMAINQVMGSECLPTDTTNWTNIISFKDIYDAESLRVLAEITRQSNEVVRGNNENLRIANNTALSVWTVFNPYQPYVPLNKVSYNGASYVCIAPCTGVYPTDTIHWLMVSDKGSNGVASMLKSSFTVTVSNTTNIIHGLSYVDGQDQLDVYYLGVLLNLTTQYTLNPNSTSIDLVGFSLNAGDIIIFKLFKGVTDSSLQALIDQSDPLRISLDASVANAISVQTALNSSLALIDCGDF